MFVEIEFKCLNLYYRILSFSVEIDLLGTAVFTLVAAAEQVVLP